MTAGMTGDATACPIGRSAVVLHGQDDTASRAMGILRDEGFVFVVLGKSASVSPELPGNAEV